MRRIVFCITCRHSAEEPEGPDGVTGGETLARHMEALLAERERQDITVDRQACLWSCLKHCNVFLQDSDRYSYLAGGFTPDARVGRGDSRLVRPSWRKRDRRGAVQDMAAGDAGSFHRALSAGQDMRRVTLILGGARSGKSRYAEGLARRPRASGAMSPRRKSPMLKWASALRITATSVASSCERSRRRSI